jgi:hypothetical protein
VHISRYGGRVGIEHDGSPLEPGRDLREQLNPLAAKRGFEVGEASDVPTRTVVEVVSYREASILGRPLKADEVAYVSEMVRRVAAILLLGPALDANYHAAKASAVRWKDGRPVM